MSRPPRSNIIKGRLFIGALVLIPVACLGACVYFASPFERWGIFGILALVVAFWCGVYYVETTK